MRRNSAILGLVLALVTFVTSEKHAYAHIRWFDIEGQHAGEHFPLDLISLLIITGAVLFAIFAFVIDRLSFHKIHVVLEKVFGLFPQGTEWRIIASLTGVLLIVNSIDGVFLAPNLVLPNEGLITFGKIAQLAIGLLLVSQISFSVAALLILVVLIPLAAIFFPISLLIDYVFEFGAVALALFFVGISSCYLDNLGCRVMKRDPAHFAHLPLPIIRIGVGLTLVVLAIHNKLIDPNLGLTFLDENDLNFLPELGFTGFTNVHFVLAAGVVELALGLLLVLGIATRLATAVLSGFLLTTMFILGPDELVGHFPLFGIAVLLIHQGSGRYRLAPLGVDRIVTLSRGGVNNAARKLGVGHGRE